MKENYLYKKFFASYLHSLRTEAVMIIQSAWRAYIEDRHAKGKDSDDTGAYDALQARLKRAEIEMMQREKDKLDGSGSKRSHAAHSNTDERMNEMMQERILEEEHERARYGNEFAESHKKQNSQRF